MTRTTITAAELEPGDHVEANSVDGLVDHIDVDDEGPRTLLDVWLVHRWPDPDDAELELEAPAGLLRLALEDPVERITP